MALHRAVIEMIRVSGGMFMLLCIASAIGIFLLMLLIASLVISRVKRCPAVVDIINLQGAKS